MVNESKQSEKHKVTHQINEISIHISKKRENEKLSENRRKTGIECDAIEMEMEVEE